MTRAADAPVTNRPQASPAARGLWVEGLAKTYPGAIEPAVGGVSFDIAEGELVSLLGPSGCGKTTTLKCIAGLERPNAGSIGFGDLTVSSAGTWVPVHERPLGMVFQSYAIWPHMTVFENVAFPLRMRKLPKKEISRRVEEALDRVRMSTFARRSAVRLSGGQQQRVAIARAVVHEPRILLLDEPLSNLDASLRRDMRADLRRMQRELGITTIYVTHDQVEACALSDRIILMNGGCLVQRGTPLDVYERPDDDFGAAFMGAANLLPAELIETTGTAALVRVRNPGGGPAVELRATNWDPESLGTGTGCSAMIRPENIQLHRPGADPAAAANSLRGVVEESVFLGEQWELIVCAGPLRLLVRTLGSTGFAPGDVTDVRIQTDHIRLVQPSRDAPTSFTRQEEATS